MVKSKIEHVQHVTIGNGRPTPTKALEVLFMIPPINIYIEQEAMTTAKRLKNNTNCWYDSVRVHVRIIKESSKAF